MRTYTARPRPRHRSSVIASVLALIVLAAMLTTTRSVGALPTSTTTTVPSCAGMSTTGGLTHDQLSTRYGFDPLRADGFDGAGATVVFIEGATSVDTALVDRFLSCQHLPGVTVETQWVAPSSHVAVGNEATVDVETVAELLPGIGTVHVLQQPGTGSFADRFSATLAHLLDAMDHGTLVPDVVSMSIGACEAGFTHEEVTRIEAQLQRLAEAGVWFMKSAGDAGSSDCAGHGTCAVTNTQLAVEYPTTSKWVTAVGGSQFAGASATGEAQVWKNTHGCSGGGGGTSTLVDRPSWQADVVDGAHRTIPDITGLAGSPMYLAMVPDAAHSSQAGWEADGGTSLSTPMYAAGMVLIRESLHARGRTLPTNLTAELYRIAADPVTRARVFTDVLVTDNDLYGVGCCRATAGYDLASGWGELHIDALRDVLEASTPTPTPEPTPPAFTG